MAQARVFVPQDALETWLSDGRGHVEGDTLALDGTSFNLVSAVRFLAEVAGGGDESALVGKVKTIAQIEELGGEHVSGSVVLGDNAYEVVEGFLAAPDMTAANAPKTPDRLIKLFLTR